MTIASVRRRINALALVMRPDPNSLDARIGRLNLNDQTTYRFHKERQTAWISQHPNRNYYDAFIEGEAPKFPDWLMEKLCGYPMTLAADVTVSQAQDAYYKLVFGK